MSTPAGLAGSFGPYGGRYVAETLVPALDELAHASETIVPSAAFRAELDDLLARYVGRPTPVSSAHRLTAALNAVGTHDGGARAHGSGRIGELLLKREDLCHTGAHKINNALGQVLLASKMGKRRIIAETGAGQHGVATATAAALFGLPCEVYQGALDVERQAPNVARMKLLGAKVIPVETGSRTLKDALSEALRDWVTNVRDTYYCVGSVAGPHPYPTLVAHLQRVIGDEARVQCRALGGPPDAVVACVGGGSNAMGIFKAFVDHEPATALYGVEAAGLGLDTEQHAATLTRGRVGVLHGARSYVLSDAAGQILEAHSVSAGLDYPGVGPEHALLHDTGRAVYLTATDDEALDAVLQVARTEGLLVALETAHAFAALPEVARREAARLGRAPRILLCVSGRGDKDLATVLARRGDRLEDKR